MSYLLQPFFNDERFQDAMRGDTGKLQEMAREAIKRLSQPREGQDATQPAQRPAGPQAGPERTVES